jgi:predicted TIM-barrel fold metal-dependent hydrolase
LYGSDFPNVRLGESLEFAREFSADSDASVKTQFFGDSAAALFGMAAPR